LPEAAVRDFVKRLAPAPSEADLLVAEAATTGSEEPLRKALELESDHVGAIEALAMSLIARGEPEEAMGLLRRIPESPSVRHLLAEARLAAADVDVDHEEVGVVLDGLLERVRDDEVARQEFLDLLETLGPEDPRTNDYRKALATRLF
jgi:putative thioredoxin